MDSLIEFFKARRKVTLALVLINIVIYAVLEALGDTENSRFMVEHGAMATSLVLEGQYWRLFTSMFLHFGFEHLAYNMFSLFFLSWSASWDRYVFWSSTCLADSGEVWYPSL